MLTIYALLNEDTLSDEPDKYFHMDHVNAITFQKNYNEHPFLLNFWNVGTPQSGR